jgi:hypothetical protein
MRIATDESIRPPHLPLVPLLQAIGCARNEHDSWWDTHAPGQDRLVASRHQLVQDPADADAVVIPVDWYWVRGNSWASRPDLGLARRCGELARRARGAGVPVVVFFTGDRSCDRIGIRDAIVLREGGYRSRMGPLDRAAPAFVDDLVLDHLDGRPTILARSERPVVGFCGLARHRSGPSVRVREAASALTTIVYDRQIHPSQFSGENLRARAIDHLRRHGRVDTDFIVRSESVFFGRTDVAQVRAEFVENLDSSLYSLCIRGSGNYSYRLYETLALGRVPVIVDTDLALPAADRVPWKEIAVWVDERDLDGLGDAIADFHRRLSADDVVSLQHRLRQLWLDHLRPAGWLSQLDDLLAGALEATVPSPRT